MSDPLLRWEEVTAPENIKEVSRVLTSVTAIDPLANHRQFQEKLRDLTAMTKHIAIYPFMYFLAQRVRPKRYLEVGILRAWSTIVVVTAHPSTEIVGVDNWSDSMAMTCEEAGVRIKAYGHVGKLTLLSGDSRKIVTPDLGVFDLILVDGGHALDVMKADLDNCAALLIPGGYLVAHDIFASHVPARVPLWNAFKERCPGWEWHEHRAVPGVCVGRKPVGDGDV